MYEQLIAAQILVVAAIHLLPISGFLGSEWIRKLYQIDISDRNLEILMRHRSVLFGIVGGVVAYSAFNEALRPLAFVIAAVSLVSFFWLSYSIGGFNDGIRRVVIADVIASVCLSGAVVMWALSDAG